MGICVLSLRLGFVDRGFVSCAERKAKLSRSATEEGRIADPRTARRLFVIPRVLASMLARVRRKRCGYDYRDVRRVCEVRNSMFFDRFRRLKRYLNAGS